MSESSRGGARKEVKSLADTLGAQELGIHIRDMAGNVRRTDLSTLKIAEYALLIGPVTNGLTQYLDTLEIQAGTKTPVVLVDEVGAAIAGNVLGEITEDPNYKLIKKISTARSRRVAYGRSINGLSGTIRSAARASASTTYSSVMTNAAVIHNAGDSRLADHDQFLNAVRRSTQLPLARPLVHLEQLEDTIRATDVLAVSHLIADADSPNAPNLVYDWGRERVAIKEPFDSWTSDSSVQTIGEISLCDVQIGCPISFSPKLVIRYYQTFCDLIEANKGWPSQFYAPQE